MIGFAKALKKIPVIVGVNLVTAFAVIVLLEGLSSFALFAVDGYRSKDLKIAERRHTKYDPDLGWVNTPNSHVPDMYGPGKYLTINSQSFRSNSDYSEALPQNKIRVICSGDSFTFGYGVSNNDTWCQLLSVYNNRIETINMGQGGYGLDQIYLWYLRDGKRFSHAIHVVAVTNVDFERMLSDTFLGYGKPMLEVKDSKLVARNTPVPTKSALSRWLQYKSGLNNLRIVKLYRTCFVPSSSDDLNAGFKIDEVAGKIIENLNRINVEKGSTLYFVYLPTYEDYSNSDESFRKGLATLLQMNNVRFIDLTPELKKLSPDECNRVFILKASLKQYESSSGHYTEEGNRFIAQALLRHMPQLSVTPAGPFKAGRQ